MSHPNQGEQWQPQPPQYPAPPQYPNPPQNAPGYAGAGYGGYPQPQAGNGLAVAALVCGIIGLLIFWVVLSPLAIIFGGIGLSKANKGASGHGKALAGLILGIVGLVGYIIVIAIVVSTTNRGFVI